MKQANYPRKRRQELRKPYVEEEKYVKEEKYTEKEWYTEEYECNEKRPEKHRESKCEVVYEPTVHCREEKEFHHCVKHIVPVVCKKVENHHYNHEYVIDKKVVKEEHRFDHGKRKEDWCKVAGCGNCHKEEDFGDDGDCY